MMHLLMCNDYITILFTDLFRLIYTTAEAKAVEQKIPRRRGMSGQSQNKNSNEFTEEFFEEAMKNIGMLERALSNCLQNFM